MSTLVVARGLSDPIQGRVLVGKITWTWPVFMLLSRTALFALAQVLIAAILALQGQTSPWSTSAAWWPYTASLTNLACIALLAWLLHREGGRLRDLYRIDRAHVGHDLLFLLLILVLVGPLGYLPNILGARLIFGDANVASAMFFHVLPAWAATAALVLFPVTNGLAELPVYYGYVMPRIKALSGRWWLALLLAAFWHGAQHCALPLIFDGRFLLWRLVMFIAFALLVGVVLLRRPRVLPYMLVIHTLMDFSLVWIVYGMSVQ